MQLAATLTIVGLAAAYLARGVWRAFAGKKAGCASGCGKCAAPAARQEKGRIALPQL